MILSNLCSLKYARFPIVMHDIFKANFYIMIFEGHLEEAHLKIQDQILLVQYLTIKALRTLSLFPNGQNVKEF